MMRRLVLSTIFFLAALAQQAQEDDSLRSAMRSGPYEQRIKAYLAFLPKNLFRSFDETIEVGHEAMALARKNGDSVAVGELKRVIGEGWYFKGKYDVAAALYYESITLLEK